MKQDLLLFMLFKVYFSTNFSLEAVTSTVSFNLMHDLVALTKQPKYSTECPNFPQKHIWLEESQTDIEKWRNQLITTHLKSSVWQVVVIVEAIFFHSILYWWR